MNWDALSAIAEIFGVLTPVAILLAHVRNQFSV
jgi:hypothetical protein